MTPLLLLSLAGTARADLPIEPEPYLLLQVQATAWDFDESDRADAAGYGDPEDDPGFKLRRARAGFEGATGALSYGFIVGVSAPFDATFEASDAVELVDAWAGWRFHPHLGLRAGMQKVPFGRENLISSSQLVFQERTVMSYHIVPGRELGAVLEGGAGPVRVEAGAFNGNGSLLGDTDPGLLLATRATVGAPGVAMDRTWGGVEGLGWSVGAAGFANFDQVTRAYAGELDAALRAGGLAVLAEAQIEQLVPADTTVDEPEVGGPTVRRGAMLQVGYSWGPWEPTVRGEWFDDDADVSDNGDLAIVTAGVTAHFLEDHVRLGGGWISRLELGGRSIPNDTARLWFQVAW